MERWEPSADAKEGELGPRSAELTRDGVRRPSLHNNPSGHEVAGLVSAPTQSLLHTPPVGLEFSHLGGGILRVPSIAGQHPLLVEVVEGVLAKRTHQLVGLARA